MIYCRKEDSYRIKQNWSYQFRFVSYITRSKSVKLKKPGLITEFSVQSFPYFFKQYQFCFLLYLVANGPKSSFQQVRLAVMALLDILHQCYYGEQNSTQQGPAQYLFYFPVARLRNHCLPCAERPQHNEYLRSPYLWQASPKKNYQALILFVKLLQGKKIIKTLLF